MTDGLSSLMVVEQNSVYQGDVSVNESFKQLKELLSKHKTVLVNRRTGRPTEKKEKNRSESFIYSVFLQPLDSVRLKRGLKSLFCLRLLLRLLDNSKKKKKRYIRRHTLQRTQQRSEKGLRLAREKGSLVYLPLMIMARKETPHDIKSKFGFQK